MIQKDILKIFKFAKEQLRCQQHQDYSIKAKETTRRIKTEKENTITIELNYFSQQNLQSLTFIDIWINNTISEKNKIKMTHMMIITDELNHIYKRQKQKQHYNIKISKY